MAPIRSHDSTLANFPLGIPAWDFRPHLRCYSVGRDTFSLAKEDKDLKYEWEVDGLPSGSQSRLHMKFPDPGIRRIQLSVDDGFGKAILSRNIQVLERDYFQKDWEHLGTSHGTKKKLQIEGSGKFEITEKDLPKDWDINGVMLAILLPMRPGSELLEIACRFNGESFPVKPGYNEFALSLSTSAMGCRFSLVNAIPEKIELEISWWPIRIGDQRNSDVETGTSGNGVLPELGGAKHVILEGSQKFLILQRNLPREWTPKRLKVGISSMILDGLTSPLDGYLEFLDNRFQLQEYYTEVSLEEYDSKVDTEFLINSASKGNLKIAWWGE